MTFLCAALTLILAAAPARAQDAAGAERWDARIASVTGEVVVYAADGGAEAAGAADMPLEEGDRVTTGEGASAELSLDGGSLIHLGENSDFTLEKTLKAESVFRLDAGSLLAKIETLGARVLKVRTRHGIAAVRGTEFAVEVPPAGAEDDATHVGVFDEGRVEVTGAGDTEVLTPNHETDVAAGAAPRRPFALKRFKARRALMKAHRRRLADLRKHWKAMAPAERRRARREVLEKMRAMRGELREKFRKRRGENRQRRREDRQGRRRGRMKPRRPGAR